MSGSTASAFCHPTQGLGRVHPDDPITAAQCRDERREHPLIRNGGQDC